MLAEIFMLRLEAISRASPPPILESSDARFVPIGAMPAPLELGRQQAEESRPD
jgi:hypothetical protein